LNTEQSKTATFTVYLFITEIILNNYQISVYTMQVEQVQYETSFYFHFM